MYNLTRDEIAVLNALSAISFFTPKLRCEEMALRRLRLLGLVNKTRGKGLQVLYLLTPEGVEAKRMVRSLETAFERNLENENAW